MANIGIIGYGFVGTAVEYGFKDDHEIEIYDKYKTSNFLEDVVSSSELIFVCLPTPYKDERIDLSIMDKSIEQISRYANGTDKIVIIKSTVVPGTTRNYSKKYPDVNFCFNPEFLREKYHLHDFVNPDRTVIGADKEEILARVAQLYRKKMPHIPMFLTDPTTAELVKYASNLFLATKVTFANEIFEYCEALDVDYNEMKGMMTADKRISDSHLDITEERGFGGKCFPKDLIALIGLGKELGLDPALMEAVWKKNLKVRKVRDWDDIPFVNSDLPQDTP